MKSEIHPQLNPVLFVDGSHEWTGVSTIQTKQTRNINGVDYYIVNVDISSHTHPFYTGQKKIVDSAGRVEKFMRRYANAQKK